MEGLRRDGRHGQPKRPNYTFSSELENWPKEGKGFYKLDEESVTTIQEDLTNDYCSLDQLQSMEITKLLEEFGEDQLQLVVELEAYETKRIRTKEDQEVEYINLLDNKSSEQSHELAD